jgi:hypothetical protein
MGRAPKSLYLERRKGFSKILIAAYCIRTFSYRFATMSEPELLNHRIKNIKCSLHSSVLFLYSSVSCSLPSLFCVLLSSLFDVGKEMAPETRQMFEGFWCGKGCVQPRRVARHSKI